MNDSIFGILDDAPDDMIREAVTPAGAYPFQVDEDEPISLDDKAAVEFHHIVAFASVRAQIYRRMFHSFVQEYRSQTLTITRNSSALLNICILPSVFL